MAYTVDYVPPTFTGFDGQLVQNGALAASSLIRGIAADQSVLLRTMPQTNFYTHRNTAMSDTEIKIPVPPYCQYAIFAFFGVVNDSKGGGVEVVLSGGAATDASRLTAFPVANSGVLERESCGWAFMESDPNGDYVDETHARAVKLVSSVSEGWQEATVEISVDTDVTIYTAAYKVLAPREMSWS